MDETPIVFDMQNSWMVTRKGEREVLVQGTKGGNKRFEFKKTRGPPTALETQIAWKSSLLTKIILRITLLVEKTLR